MPSGLAATPLGSAFPFAPLLFASNNCHAPANHWPCGSTRAAVSFKKESPLAAHSLAAPDSSPVKLMIISVI